MSWVSQKGNNGICGWQVLMLGWFLLGRGGGLRKL